MSEDTVSIFCKVDKRSTKKIDAIKTCVSDFCKENNLNPPNSYFKNNLFVNEIVFFEPEAFDNIPRLLSNLASLSKKNPVAKYEFDTVNEVLYYAVTNNYLREFNKFKDAFNTKHIEYIPDPIDINAMGIVPNKISFIKISYKDSKKKNIIDYLSSFMSDSASNFTANAEKFLNFGSVDKENYKIFVAGKDWDGQIERIIPYVKFVSDRGGYVLIGMDVFDENLLPIYPSKESTDEALLDDKELNNEFGVNFYKGNLDSASKDLRRHKLSECVEVLLDYFLSINGVSAGSVAFRHNELWRNQEIYSTGSGNDGVYICGLHSISKIEDWLSK